MRIVVFLLLLNISAYSQVLETGDFHSKINGSIVNAPTSGSGLYSIPSPTEFTTWQSALSNLFNGNFTACNSDLNTLSYQLTNYTDNSQSLTKTYYIIEKQTSGTNYWGTYVYNNIACNNNLVIQSPHAKYDSNTGQEGALVFTHSDALFLMINGTHRCDHSSFSSCSGSTSSCGTSQNFRISDMAHNVNSIFQVTTEFLLNLSSNYYFVQLHGFGKQPTDPSVIMSNGTRITVTPNYINSIQQNLFNLDNNLTFKIAHTDLSWTRLIGFTNTQGRLINGETTPCTSSATATTGHFIHLEQEKPLLRQDSTKWAIMAEAIRLSFNCFVGVEEIISTNLSVYPNPSTGKFNLKSEGIKNVSVYNLVGLEIKNFSYYQNIIDLSNVKNGTYILKMELNMGEIIVKKVVIQSSL